MLNKQLVPESDSTDMALRGPEGVPSKAIIRTICAPWRDTCEQVRGTCDWHKTVSDKAKPPDALPVHLWHGHSLKRAVGHSDHSDPGGQSDRH